MRNIKHIVIHCTATSQDTKVTSIERFWREKLHWKSPGYHYVIQANGVVHTLLTEDKVSNGVRGHNAHSIHISYIGGIDEHGNAKDTRTLAQRNAMLELVRQLKRRYPEADVLGHRDLSPDENGDGIIQPREWVKECPSFDVRAWLKTFNIS